jgi:hypothetical protein
MPKGDWEDCFLIPKGDTEALLWPILAGYCCAGVAYCYIRIGTDMN